MNNNWYAVIHYGAQPIENVPLMNDREAARCVKRNELEALTGRDCYPLVGWFFSD